MSAGSTCLGLQCADHYVKVISGKAAAGKPWYNSGNKNSVSVVQQHRSQPDPNLVSEQISREMALATEDAVGPQAGNCSADGKKGVGKESEKE